jgi:four helix bundle protein
MVAEGIMSANILKEKADAFGDRIIACCCVLKERGTPKSLEGQLFRSGTSVGANVAEAQFAQGKKDFISKLEISLKEINETEYWLERIYKGQYISEREYKSMRNDCIAIRRLLIASVTTVKKKLNQEKQN